MININDYKGLILITFIIFAILYFSPDLECMLLFSGILVNIITICLNTGALKLTKNGASNKAKFSDKCPDDTEEVNVYRADSPDFSKLSKADDLLEDMPVSQENMVADKLKVEPLPPIDKSYPGAIDYEDASQPIQISTDRIPLVSNARQGVNARRQTVSSAKKRQLLYPTIAYDLDVDEKRFWWGNYDEVTTISPKDAPY